MKPSGEVTRILADVRSGRDGALEDLIPLVYEELRDLAARHLRRERRGHTLQPTALIHEAWLRLVGENERRWENRIHFLSIASLAMRRVLVNHARDRRAAKRRDEHGAMSVSDADHLLDQQAGDLLDLHEAMLTLEEREPEKSRIVELRFFGGLSFEEIAEIMGRSTRTVERSWRFGRAFLRRELERSGSGR